MQRCNGNVAAAARMLGLSRAQLAYRLKQASPEMRTSLSSLPTSNFLRS
jgi:transcriptional regulator with GAF, ATPase, and Fis domain